MERKALAPLAIIIIQKSLIFTAVAARSEEWNYSESIMKSGTFSSDGADKER